MPLGAQGAQPCDPLTLRVLFLSLEVPLPYPSRLLLALTCLCPAPRVWQVREQIAVVVLQEGAHVHAGARGAQAGAPSSAAAIDSGGELAPSPTPFTQLAPTPTPLMQP